MSDVVALGECMIETSLHDDGSASVAYAGDTFNTSVYLSRLGLSVAYATALGLDDPFSAAILRLMEREGIDTGLVGRVQGRLPGVYIVSRDAEGERRLYYWRGEAPVRELFEIADIERMRQAFCGARLIYISGVSLAVIGERGRAALAEHLAEARAAGAEVAFDTNYRPSLWSEPAVARSALAQFVGDCRYISTSAVDLRELYDETPESVAAGWSAQGTEVVLRQEDRSLVIFREGLVERISPAPFVRPIDMTGAGDAFNACYLAGRLAGRTPQEAATAGRRLARIVVQHMGAIISKEAMPQV